MKKCVACSVVFSAQKPSGVHEGATRVIVRFPLIGLVGSARHSGAVGRIVPTASVVIDRMQLDELPLLPKGTEIDACILAVLCVHDGQCVEPFSLHPPNFVGVVSVSAESIAFVIKASVFLVPTPVQGMVNQTSRDAPRLLIVGDIQNCCCLDEQIRGFDIVSK